MADFDRTTGEFPPLVKNLVAVWPLVACVFAVTIAGAQASAKIADHDAKISEFSRLAMDRQDRMARIETQLVANQHQLDRIEQKLDAIGK